MTIPLINLLTIPIVPGSAIRQQQASRRNWAWVAYGRRLANASHPVWASSGYVDLDAR
jgi:hypothetical protein